MANLLLIFVAQVALAIPELPEAGFGTALAADERTLVVLGRSFESGRLRVPMLVYEVDGDVLAEPNLLEVRGPATARVGEVAVDEGRIAVGLWLADSQPRTRLRGFVVLFERGSDHPAWSEVARIRARGAHSRFGESLDLDGDTLVVGAPGAASAGPCGAVQVFRLPEEGWEHEEQLLPERGPRFSPGRSEDGFFGTSVAISGDQLVVGAPGQPLTIPGGPAYVFDRRWSDWGLVGLLDPCELGPVRPGALESPWTRRGICYGASVDIEGDVVVVGSTTQGRGTRGEVLIHERDESGWSLTQILTPPDDSIAAGFGAEVLLKGDLLMVVSHGPWSPTGYHHRVVHGYRRDGPCWFLAGGPVVGTEGAELGPAIAVSGDHLFAGSSGANGGSGAVFSYSIAEWFPEPR